MSNNPSSAKDKPAIAGELAITNKHIEKVSHLLKLKPVTGSLMISADHGNELLFFNKSMMPEKLIKDFLLNYMDHLIEKRDDLCEQLISP